MEQVMVPRMELRTKKASLKVGKRSDKGASVSREEVWVLRNAARIIARAEVADAVTTALNDYEGSLRDLQSVSGLDPAFVSRLARGIGNKQGATVASLAQIALAMNKTLAITIE